MTPRRRWTLVAVLLIALFGIPIVAARLLPDPPVELALARPPYMGVSCPEPNPIHCDRVKLAVWLRDDASRLTATMDGRTATLSPPRDRPPSQYRDYWEGAFQPAGLHDGALRIGVGDDGLWLGDDPQVSVPVQLVATLADGRVATTTVQVQLSPGYGKPP